MKKLAVLFFFFSYLLYSWASKALANEKTAIIYFYGQGCGHCAKVENYIKQSKLNEIYRIEEKEIFFNKQNASELNSLFEKFNIPIAKRGVPAMKAGESLLIGDGEIIDWFNLSSPEVDDNEKNNNSQNSHLSLPLVIGAALVDSINPCEFAVLLILLSTMTIIKKDKTALKGGLLFSLAIFLSYFAMGIGIYKALSTTHFSLTVVKVIGVVAIVIGFWNLKDFLAYNRFLPPIEVPMSWRPKMKSIIRSVTSPLGAFLTGFLISLFLLPCTSGPYIIILSMLSQKETFVSALVYLLLYNLIFVSPMIAITFLVYKGLNPEKAESIRVKNIRRLHLVAGLIMIAMGLYILFIY